MLLRHIIRTFISDISGEFFLSHKKERIKMIDDKYGLFEKKKKKDGENDIKWVLWFLRGVKN